MTVLADGTIWCDFGKKAAGGDAYTADLASIKKYVFDPRVGHWQVGPKINILATSREGDYVAFSTGDDRPIFLARVH